MRHVKLHIDRKTDVASHALRSCQPLSVDNCFPSSSGVSDSFDVPPMVPTAVDPRVPEKHPEDEPETRESSTADFISGLRAQGVSMKVCNAVVKEMQTFGRRVANECQKSGSGNPTSGSSQSDSEELPSIAHLDKINSRSKLYNFAKMERVTWRLLPYILARTTRVKRKRFSMSR